MAHTTHSEMKKMSAQEKLHSHYEKTLWVYWVILGLGFWMIASPFTLGYLNPELWVNPSGGRGVWFSQETFTSLRANLMAVSDVVSGFVLLTFGWIGLKPNRPISLWVCCGVGAWLNFAPLLFWAPTSVAYLNNTLVGTALIALTVLVPGMPNMVKYMRMGGDRPLRWSYNPSSWPQRWIMILTGFLGWIVSRYLATYQLGYSNYVWDPFFGFAEGTQRVLDSNMSHAWPISDAGLGALSYTFEFLMGWMGSSSRWRTMPWMVTFFGILVIPLGLTHIILVISQPVVVGAWCTMCILAAAIMLPMIPLEVDEVFAMVQHLKEAKRRGDRNGSLWLIFWKGGSGQQYKVDERSPPLLELPDKPKKVLLSSIWGLSFPWTLVTCSIVGAWLMFSPAILGAEKFLSDLEHLIGALVIVVSVISMGEIVRVGRYLNLLLAALLVSLPWFFTSVEISQAINIVISGILVSALSWPLGRIKEHYGPWQKYIF